MRSQFFLYIVLLSLGACNSQPGADEKATEQQTSAPVDPDTVTRTAFVKSGKNWPFSVEEGRVGCTPEGYLWFEANGIKFGLNGFALDHGYSALEPIWLKDEKIIQASRAAGLKNDPYTPRVSVGDMIDEVRTRCA